MVLAYSYLVWVNGSKGVQFHASKTGFCVDSRNDDGHMDAPNSRGAGI